MARLIILRKNLILNGIYYFLLAFICFAYSCKNQVKTTPTEQATPTVDTASVPTMDTAVVEKNTTPIPIEKLPTVKRKMGCGVEINIPEKGMEAELLNIASDPSIQVNKGQWLVFDRLEFKEGSSVDMAKSAQQMFNLAAIIKCYPSLRLKIGAYSEGTGNADENKKLAFTRVEVVKAALIALGAPATNIVVEPFGEKTQPASEKASNHRVMMQVLAK